MGAPDNVTGISRRYVRLGGAIGIWKSVMGSTDERMLKGSPLVLVDL